MATLPPSLTNMAQYASISAVVTGMLVLYLARKALTVVLFSAVVTLVIIVLVFSGIVYYVSQHMEDVVTAASSVIPELQLLRQIDVAKLVPVLVVLQEVDPVKLKSLLSIAQ